MKRTRHPPVGKLRRTPTSPALIRAAPVREQHHLLPRPDEECPPPAVLVPAAGVVPLEERPRLGVAVPHLHPVAPEDRGEIGCLTYLWGIGCAAVDWGRRDGMGGH